VRNKIFWCRAWTPGALVAAVQDKVLRETIYSAYIRQGEIGQGSGCPDHI
jgi:hypothetical protein